MARVWQAARQRTNTAHYVVAFAVLLTKQYAQQYNLHSSPVTLPTEVKKPTLPLKSKLKKDPGVPRLPDLKVRSAEIQRRRSVRLALAAKIVTLTSQAQSPLRDPPHEDAVMASKPTPSSLAQLATSATTVSSPLLRQGWASWQRLEEAVVDGTDVVLTRAKVRRGEAEGKRFAFVFNKIDLAPDVVEAPSSLSQLIHSRTAEPTTSLPSARQREPLQTLFFSEPMSDAQIVGASGAPFVMEALWRGGRGGNGRSPGHRPKALRIQGRGRLNSRKRARPPTLGFSDGGGDHPDPNFRAPTRLCTPSGKRQRTAALHKAAVGAGMGAYIISMRWLVVTNG
ncbi:hypothetical protein EDB92DRAFT_1814436 [Lactarius akahatsu]|uniref:Uncharacterized protein n=1 Tax=Lactarius akahatsu TaxID=416441 RepID=A0AAD4LR05_9AGAM|nr:hypothetical protein EDB92DRAFT_1814436 [Lactarius akahatsu]